MQKEAKFSTAIVVICICLALVIANGFIIMSAYNLGRGPRRGAETISERFHQDGEDFQFKSFQIQQLDYTIPPNLSIDCSNDNHTMMNMTPVIWVDEEFSFEACTFWIDGEMKETIMELDLMEGGELVVPLGEISIRKNHSFKFCCDNYCNGKKLNRLCDEVPLE